MKMSSLLQAAARADTFILVLLWQTCLERNSPPEDKAFGLFGSARSGRWTEKSCKTREVFQVAKEGFRRKKNLEKCFQGKILANEI